MPVNEVTPISEDEKRPDPLEVFERYEKRLETEARLSDYKWQLHQIERLQKESQGDLQKLRELQELAPYIEASNLRGDFEHPWQMDRQAARQYLDEKGVVPGPVMSLAEVHVIANDPKLWAEYGSEVKRAQSEGRVIMYTPAGKVQNRVVHFKGESFEGEGHQAFQRALKTRLDAIDLFNKAKGIVTETTEKLAGMEREKMDDRTKFDYLLRQIKSLNELDQRNYPIESIDGLKALADEYHRLEKEFIR